jgi:hypothetical protein
VVEGDRMRGSIPLLNIPCEYPFIIDDRVDCDGQIFIDIDSGIFEIMKIWDFDVFRNGGNTIFTLIIRKKGVVITGN